MQYLSRLLFVLLFSCTGTAYARNYSLPADIGSGAFSSCSGTGPVYSCTGTISLDEEDSVSITSDVTLNIDVNLLIDEEVSVNDNGFALNFNVTGNVIIDEDSSIDGNITAGGTINIDSDSRVNGVCTPNHARCSGVASGPSIDHFSITHAGIGVTCEAETITVTAHDVSHALITPLSSTTLTLSTSIANDGWALQSGGGTFNAPNQYTFDGSENSVVFGLTKTSATSAPHMDIDVTDGSTSDLDGDVTEDINLEFRDTAFRFYADGVNNAIATQVAGKPSSVVPGNQALTLRAVQTNTDTGACQARISGSQTVQMAFECIDPNSCKTNNGVSITEGAVTIAINDNPQGSVSSYANVDLTFDGSGIATWSMNYLDAGQIRLHATLDIAASGDDPADTLTGVSNAFTVVPAGLCVSSPDVNADCASGDAGCSAFKRAGETFNLAVKAVAWESAGEGDTDFCSGNATTVNFQLASIVIAQNLVAPAGAVGAIGVNSFDMSAADNGDHNMAGQSISEVGVFTFTASPPAYFSETIATSTSANIGRFYPHHFDLSAGSIINRIALGGGIYSYMDEDFQINYTLTARNTANTATHNYKGSFAFLDSPGEINYGAVDTATPLSGRLTTDIAPVMTWNNGSMTLTDNGNISRNAMPDGPYALMSIGIAPVDEDGVMLNSYDLDVDADSTDEHGLTASTEIRFGRMSLQNVFGSELITLNMPMRAEYFNGSNFVLNDDDNLSAFSVTDLLLSNGVELGQADGDIQVRVGQVSTAAINNNPLLTGDAGLSFCPPGNPACTATSGNVGYIDVQIDLTVSPYLQFDWDADGNHDNDPTSRATFGIFNGNSKHIYFRQIY